jgi:hypothetical protein
MLINTPLFSQQATYAKANIELDVNQYIAFFSASDLREGKHRI